MTGKKLDVTKKNSFIECSIIVAKNQKIFQVHRVSKVTDYKANWEALKNLSTNAYVLYMYLYLHDPDRIWALSSKDVYNKTSLTSNTYPKAVQELIDKNYLVAGIIETRNEILSENVYHFYETPSLKAIEFQAKQMQRVNRVY